MESVLNLKILFPLSLVLLQTLFVVLSAYLILIWWKIIKRPVEGMEYGAALIAAGFIFSCLLISSSSIDGIYESFRNYSSQGEGWAAMTWAKFLQFMLVLCAALTVFAGVIRALMKVTITRKSQENISSEHTIVGLFVLAAMLGLAFILKLFSKNMVEDLVPGFKTFNGV